MGRSFLHGVLRGVGPRREKNIALTCPGHADLETVLPSCTTCNCTTEGCTSRGTAAVSPGWVPERLHHGGESPFAGNSIVLSDCFTVMNLLAST